MEADGKKAERTVKFYAFRAIAEKSHSLLKRNPVYWGDGGKNA